MDLDQLYDEDSQAIVETTEAVDDASDLTTPAIAYNGTSGNPGSSASALESHGRADTALQDFVSAPPRNGRLGDAYSSSVTPTRHQPPPRPSPMSSQPTFTVKVPPPKFLPLPYATSRSGLVFDVRMRFHEYLFPKANEDAHPEVPSRISTIFNDLVDAGLVSNPDHPENDSEHQLVRILIRVATPAEICLVHSVEHLEWVQGLAGRSK